MTTFSTDSSQNQTKITLLPDLPQKSDVQLQKQLDFMKRELIQNLKQCENICSEYYKTLGNSELALFDCLLTEYLLLNPTTGIEKLRSKIDSMCYRSYNITSGDQKDLDDAKGYSANIHMDICESIGRMQKLKNRDGKPQHPLPKKSAEEIQKYLSEVKIKLESDIRRIPTSRNISKINYNMTKDPEEDDTEVSPEFIAWMKKNLKQENSSLREMFLILCSKYRTVKELMTSVEQVRKKRSDNIDLDYQNCGVSSISRSPFMVAAKSNYKFLLTMLNDVRMQKNKVIPHCLDLIQNCDRVIQSFKRKYDDIIKKKSSDIATEQKSLKMDQEAISEMRSKLKPFAKELIIAPTAEYYKPFTSSGDEHFEKLEKMLRESNKQDELVLLDKIRTERKNIINMCNETASTLQEAANFEITIYKILTDEHRSEEKDIQYSQEKARIQNYAGSLRSFISTLGLEQLRNWDSKLDAIYSTLVEIRDGSSSYQSMFNQKYNQAGHTAELDALEKETEELLEQREKLESELVQLSNQNQKLTEQLITQIAKANRLQYKSTEGVSAKREEEIMDIKRCILCPKCQTNIRNCIMLTCNHTCCKSCLIEGKHECPVCGTTCPEKQVAPLYFQK